MPPVHLGKIVEISDLRDQVRIFRNRDHAGRVVAEMLEEYRGTDTTILAVPSGGVPVGVAIAEELNLPLEAAVVSKITLPWNTEAGWGFAVAEAYWRWVDLEEEEAARLCKDYQTRFEKASIPI